jgi:hypothetical protein
MSTATDRTASSRHLRDYQPVTLGRSNLASQQGKGRAMENDSSEGVTDDPALRGSVAAALGHAMAAEYGHNFTPAGDAVVDRFLRQLWADGYILVPERPAAPAGSGSMTPETALALARELHGARVDILGEDYVSGHLTRVVAAVVPFGDPILSVAGALHDTVEDTGATPELLLSRGVPPEAVEVVMIVTKQADEHGAEGYRRFIDRIVASANLRAVRAKRGDLADHLRLVPAEQEKRVRGLLRRYREADALLAASEAALVAGGEGSRS